MYALQTIEKMNSRASERQATEAAILAAFTLHYSLSRKFRVVQPSRATKQYDLALATYEENPGLRHRMREIAPDFLLMRPPAGDHLVPRHGRLVVKPIGLYERLDLARGELPTIGTMETTMTYDEDEHPADTGYLCVRLRQGDTQCRLHAGEGNLRVHPARALETIEMLSERGLSVKEIRS